MPARLIPDWVAECVPQTVHAGVAAVPGWPPRFSSHCQYRTKHLILEIYDELAEAIATGRPYQTRLDPPPADPRVAHPTRDSTRPQMTNARLEG